MLVDTRVTNTEKSPPCCWRDTTNRIFYKRNLLLNLTYFVITYGFTKHKYGWCIFRRTEMVDTILIHLCVLWGRCTVLFCCPESKRLRQGKEVGLRNVSWMWPRLYVNPRGRMPNDSLRYQSDIDS